MMQVYYENNLGRRINLDEWPVAIEDVTNLFGKEWKYETIENRAKNCTVIDGFYRTNKQKTINVQIFADSKEEFEKLANEIEEVTEYDVIKNVPGKLWCGEFYLECFITETEPSDYDDLFYATNIKIKIVSFQPFWINENPYTFHSREIESSSNDKRYPHKYPYRYANGMNNSYIINPHFTETNFELIIYGPVSNPQVTIGENTYLVNIILEEREYLKVSSRDATVKKILINGEVVNAFHNRQKGKNFFQKISPGRQQVTWSGKFDWDLILYEERSEPKWGG